MIKILSVVPVLYDPGWTANCLNAIHSDILVIDNNAEKQVKKVIAKYDKIVNKKNVFVNPAWNQGMGVFLEGDWDYIAIIGSDFVLIEGWEQIVSDNVGDEIIMLPNIHPYEEGEGSVDAPGGFPGVFILLDRKMAGLVYPIPEGLLIWFGDQWIYERLEKHGYKKRIYYDLKGMHGNSISVRKLPEAYDVIEEDKRAWETVKLRI